LSSRRQPPQPRPLQCYSPSAPRQHLFSWQLLDISWTAQARSTPGRCQTILPRPSLNFATAYPPVVSAPVGPTNPAPRRFHAASAARESLVRDWAGVSSLDGGTQGLRRYLLSYIMGSAEQPALQASASVACASASVACSSSLLGCEPHDLRAPAPATLHLAACPSSKAQTGPPAGSAWRDEPPGRLILTSPCLHATDPNVRYVCLADRPSAPRSCQLWRCC
jgi:hypothetical protein